MISELTLRRLQSVHAYPAVSVLACPAVPGPRLSPADLLRLHQLIDRAESRLAAELPDSRVEPIVDDLNYLATAAANQPAAEGVGLFASDTIAEAVLLPTPVAERVVVDPTFATRDLVRALARTLRYRVVVLSGRRPRVFDGMGTALHPLLSNQLSALSPRRRRRREHRVGVEASALRDTQLQDVLRATSAALAEVARVNPLPLVIVGPPKHLALFEAMGGCPSEIAGSVLGSHDRTPPARLTRLVLPVIEAYLEKRCDEVLGYLDGAVGARRAATSLDAVWTATLKRQVELLVVEESFTFPARVCHGGNRLVSDADVEAPYVLDDAIDEVVEMVARAGGETVFVRDGSLADRGRISAVLHRSGDRHKSSHAVTRLSHLA